MIKSINNHNNVMSPMLLTNNVGSYNTFKPTQIKIDTFSIVQISNLISL